MSVLQIMGIWTEQFWGRMYLGDGWSQQKLNTTHIIQMLDLFLIYCMFSSTNYHWCVSYVYFYVSFLSFFVRLSPFVIPSYKHYSFLFLSYVSTALFWPFCVYFFPFVKYFIFVVFDFFLPICFLFWRYALFNFVLRSFDCPALFRVISKFRRSRVPTRDLLLRQILKVYALGWVEAQYLKDQIVFRWSTNISPIRCNIRPRLTPDVLSCAWCCSFVD